MGLLYVVSLALGVTGLAAAASAGPPSDSGDTFIHRVLAGYEQAPAMRATLYFLQTVAWWLRLVTAIFFFVWISRVFQAARDLDARPGYTASWVIVGFFIPILNLIRPYQGLRALDTAIDPLTLPEPPPRPEVASHAGSYREAALVDRGSAFDVRPPPLLGWWVLWLGSGVVSLLGFAVGPSWVAVWVSHVLNAAGQAICAALAVVVVHRISERLMERARRLAGAST
jgi:hypothetical protein